MIHADEILREAPPQPRRLRDFRPVIVAVAATVALAVGIQEWFLSARSTGLLAAASQRAEVILETRAEAVGNWLDGLRSTAHSVRNNHLFRLFASELGTADPADESRLSEQLPYLQAAFDAFARAADLRGAYLIGTAGNALLASSGAPPLDAPQREKARRMFPRTGSDVVALRSVGGALMLDMLLPVHPVQAPTAADASRTAAILLLTVPAERLLAEATAPGRLLLDAERVRLVQPGDGVAHPDGFAAAESPEGGFARRPSLVDGGDVYGVGKAVTASPWHLVYERDAGDVREPITAGRLVTMTVAVLLAATAAALMVALWWRQSQRSSHLLAEQYFDLAGRLNAQRRLLTSINDAISEQLMVTDRHGAVVYANNAFTRAAGVGDCTGRRLAALLPPDLAAEVSGWTGKVLTEGVAQGGTVMIGDDDRHWFTVTVVPLVDDGASTVGAVTVARDDTAMFLERERRERRIKATVRALSRSVAAVDPHLDNHAHRLEQTALGIADKLGLSDASRATLELAAHLSQVGKIFLPRDLIGKTTRLTSDERRATERHVEHARDILREVDFDLPVIDTISAMHERLDGTGYPRGLTAEHIGIEGRILAVADVFAARTEPRFYRRAAPAPSVLEILRKNALKYDPRVVEALGEWLAETGAAAGNAAD